MAIQTRSQQKNSPVLHIVIAAGAVAAIAVSAIVPLSRSGSERSSEGPLLSASIVPAVSADQRFAEEMALHEALTEASFGTLEVSRASVAAQAIAEHNAAFPQVLQASVVTRDSSSEAARAIAEHSAAFPVSELSVLSLDPSVAGALAEHDALIEAFVS